MGDLDHCLDCGASIKPLLYPCLEKTCPQVDETTIDWGRLSRSIQRMRTFVEGDYPPCLMTSELDLMEKWLADQRR